MPKYTTLFLDLDDTLYPQDSGVWEAIGNRIHLFIVERLGVQPEQAQALRSEYLRMHGTTLNGLMIHHNVDPLDYLDFVHTLPLQEMLSPSPELHRMLEKLPQKKVVFTNASHSHAARVLESLGISQQIDLIIDILALRFQNKPLPEAYRRALDMAGEPDPKACVMVDDRVENLYPGTGLGMTTVLVGAWSGNEPVDYHIGSITDLWKAIPALMDSESRAMDAE